MKRTVGVLGIALMLSFGSARVLAQAEAASTPKASETKIESEPITYRLTYTITEMDGAKRIGSQHFSMTLSCSEIPSNHMWTSEDARFRLGSKIPVATEASNPASLAPTKVQYMDVGLNARSHVRKYANGVEVTSWLEQSSVSEEESGVGKGNPVIRQATLENTALLTPGKPMMLGSLDIPGSTRHLDVEVVVEVVR
jgi:hypothetical protein